MAPHQYHGREDYRDVDPARGPFDPTVRQPPHGVFRPGKTRQDRMKPQDRPRVQEWEARR